jgi:2-keto-3-deoxy-galactonokinase
MAAKKKAAKAGAAAAAPYVHRVITDEELRDNVRVAVDSAREAFSRLQNGKGVPKTVLDDKKFHRDVSKAAVALKDASDALREGPKRKKRKGGLLRKLLFLAVAGGVAVAVSEDVRNKVLDTLFGKEEEFDYTSSTAPSTPAPAPTETANAAS